MYTDFDEEDRREGLCKPKVHKQTVVYTEKLLMDISHKISLTECFHNETFKFLLKKTGPKPQLLILSHQEYIMLREMRSHILKSCAYNNIELGLSENLRIVIYKNFIVFKEYTCNVFIQSLALRMYEFEKLCSV